MIPWATILKHAPAIMAAADALRVRARTSSSEDKGRGIEARLSSLEQGSRESAQLLQDIAQQTQALALAQEIAARRARIVGVAIAASVLAICAGVLAFVW
jgi:hypothetical protein